MFSDVIGHSDVIGNLKNIIKSGRIANAYIFAGPSDVGKELVAINFAKALNCTEVKGDFCDQCVSCRRINDGNHTDVRLIRPDGAKLKIEQMRFLKRQGSYKALESEHKIYIIVDAEKMTTEAANSMLKTLEEPSGDTLFILLTPIYNALLPTIRSRCQLVRFSFVPQQVLQEGLTKQIGIPESKAKWLALKSQGKPGKALRMANETKDSEDEMSWVLPILSQRDKGLLLQTFKRAEEMSKTEGSFDIILSWYRDLLLIKHGCSDNLLTHINEKKQLEQIAKSYSVIELENLITMALNMQNLIQRNINSVLAMEVMMFNTFNTFSTRL